MENPELRNLLKDFYKDIDTKHALIASKIIENIDKDEMELAEKLFCINKRIKEVQSEIIEAFTGSRKVYF
jgi:hypothetical protein